MECNCSCCESLFDIKYEAQMVSDDYPEYCPFCGERIDEINESYIQDDNDESDGEEWT